MVGLGAALAARGHQVKIVTNPYFEDVVTSAGLEMLPLGTREDYVRLSEHPDLWHPLRGPKLVLGYASAKMLRPLYDLLIANYIPGDTVFCAHAMGWRSWANRGAVVDHCREHERRYRIQKQSDSIYIARLQLDWHREQLFSRQLQSSWRSHRGSQSDVGTACQ